MSPALTDKVALVAGSSRGIGLSISQALLREGAKVVITGRNADSLSAARDRLAKEAGASRVVSVEADMTSSVEIRRAVDAAVSSFGGMDAVVANVGSGAARGGWEVSEEDWQGALRVNLLGGMALAATTLPHLISRGGGSLTFIASIAGWEAIDAPVAYSAAKAAMLSATKSLSRLVGPHGVRVNAVAPGNILFAGGRWERKLAEERKRVEQYIEAEVPLRRFGTPEEVAEAVVFLASERASFITGACLVVDGGQTRSL